MDDGDRRGCGRLHLHAVRLPPVQEPPGKVRHTETAEHRHQYRPEPVLHTALSGDMAHLARMDSLVLPS